MTRKLSTMGKMAPYSLLHEYNRDWPSCFQIALRSQQIHLQDHFRLIIWGSCVSHWVSGIKFEKQLGQLSQQGPPCDLELDMMLSSHPITPLCKSLPIGLLSFFGGTGIWTQDFTLAKQVIYQSMFSLKNIYFGVATCTFTRILDCICRGLAMVCVYSPRVHVWRAYL
jgi:hypothetical protein